MTDAIAPRTERFLAVYDTLRRRLRWEDGTTLRYTALGLSFLPDPGTQAVDRLTAAAASIRDRARFFSELRGSIRYPLAAMLLRRGGDLSRALDQVDRNREALRRHRVGRGGGIHVTIAAFLLLGSRPGREPRSDTLDRADDLYERMRQRHRFLTDRSDVPMVVALARLEDEVAVLDPRIEDIYRGLVAQRCGRSNATQLAAEILTLGAKDAGKSCTRFLAWRRRLREAGLPWRSPAYDEIALLSLLPERAVRIEGLAGTVEHVRGKGGFWSRLSVTRELALSLAVGLHLGALGEGDPALCRSFDAGLLAAVRQAVEAQQAAVVAAACIAASVAATSAASS